MVVTAGIHAARDVQVDGPQVIEVVVVVKAPLDGLGDGNGLGIGEGAVVPAGAADDVGEMADVGGGELVLHELSPERMEILLAEVGQHHVLLVGGADSPHAVFVGQVGNGLELLGGAVSRGVAEGLQRQVDDAIARLLVVCGIVAQPVGKGRGALGLARQLRLGGLVVQLLVGGGDRKSTRLNSSHVAISYAVFCLKQKNR